jgi:hypothetical protein
VKMLLKFLKLGFGNWCLVMLLAQFHFRYITESLAYLLSFLMWQVASFVILLKFYFLVV